MSGPESTLSIYPKTIAVFLATASIAFYPFFVAVVYQILPLIPVSPVVNFSQLVSGLVYATLVGAIVAIAYSLLKTKR